MSKLNIISETKLLDIESIDKKMMTSLEIAKLTNKNHAHVMRDIRNMLSNLGNESTFGLVDYVDAKGESRPMYQLDKNHTLCLITRYSDKLRMAIIQRWQELEGNPLRALFEKIQLTKKVIEVNGTTWGKAGNEQKKNKAIITAYEELIKEHIHEELDLFLTSN